MKKKPHPATNYIEPEELARILRESQAEGVLSAEMVTLLRKMVKGIGGSLHITETEDVLSEVWLAVQLHLRQIDIDKNPFGYLSTVIFNAFYLHSRKAREFIKLKNNYAGYLRTRHPEW